MQPSQMAIEREFEALRDIRRRSTSQGSPGALIIDPDLPAQQPSTVPPLSPKAWVAGDDAASSTHSHEDDSGSSEGGASAEDPFHLFWVPAHLHPELAPSEFRSFLKDHARTPSEGVPAATLERSSSSSSLGRKRSMLSRQYKPRVNDGVEEEHVVPIRRNKSIYKQDGPQLTIGDLQKLEALADEASKSDDPTKLRRMLRRSMSLNVAPSFLDQIDDVPDATDEADAPIIVPPPGQILRRTARTKIRKPNLSGDGGGHRFPASRRKSTGRSASIDNVTSPTDGSSSGHGEIEPFVIPPLPPLKIMNEPEISYEDRRLTYTEESSIYDAYADSPEDEKPPSPKATSPPARIFVASPPPVPPVNPLTTVPLIPDSIPPPPQHLPQQPQVEPILYQPKPQHHLTPAIQQHQQALQQPSRTPSPDASSTPSSLEIQRPDSRSSMTSDAHSVLSVSDKRKEKDKKSLWRKVGGGSEKGTKKNGKDAHKEREKEKEKESGFFGSLFGGGKKKQEEQQPSNLGGGAGPATAAALLGASKSSKAYSPSISPQLGNPYARYPIHVERAVYRLSHIKLANPRRPLYEQVLISNLMFWYLGVINKSHQGPGQNQSQNQNQQAQGQANGPQAAEGPSQVEAQTPPATGSEKEHLEREQREREREREEREKAERERADREQRREPRRGSLTKPAPSTASTGRRAEMPVKGPQYHLQSQVIEQEYGPGPSPVPVARTSSAPPASPPVPQGYNAGQSHRLNQAQPIKTHQQPPYPQPNGNQNYYYGRSGSVDSLSASPQPSASNLPPGAMSPHQTTEQLWLASQSSSNTAPRPPLTSTSPNHNPIYSPNQSPPRSSRTPPPNHHYSNNEWGRGAEGGGKVPTRSHSANAVAPVPAPTYHGQHNGVLKKKVASAHAISPDRRQRVSEASEEEDVPLAVWQQRRK